MKKLVLAVCLVSLFGGLSFAREVKRSVPAAPAVVAAPERIERVNQSDGMSGFGFNAQLPAITSLSLRYWATKSMGIEGILGFSFSDTTKFFDIGGKILGTIKKESNMRVYGFGLVGICNSSIKSGSTDSSSTDFVIGTGLGAEFFLNGLPNLGFGVEAGIGYNSGTKVFGTQGDMTSVGIRYYFQ